MVLLLEYNTEDVINIKYNDKNPDDAILPLVLYYSNPNAKAIKYIKKE